MARLPSAVPTETPALGVVSPDASRSIPSYQAGQVGGAMQQVGAEAQAAATQIQQTQDRLAQAKGMSDFLTAKLDLDQQAESDPDYATLPKRYSANLMGAAKQAASGIVSPVIRAEFTSGLTRMMNAGQDRVLSISHGKAVDAGRGYTDTFNEGIADQYARATDEDTRTALLDAAHQNINAAVDRGWYTNVEADRVRKALVGQVTTQRARLLAETNPDLALRLLAPQAIQKQQTQSDLPITVEPLPTIVDSDLAGSIHAAAEHNPGVSQDYLTRTAMVENSGKTNNAFQFRPATARESGLTNVNDPYASADAAAKLALRNKAALASSLGRDPTEAELYLAHQQGATGAAALLDNPERPAVMALMETGLSKTQATERITQNGGKATMLSGDFAKLWADRYGAVNTSAQRPGATPPDQRQAMLKPSNDTESTFPLEGDWRDHIPLPQRLEAVDLAQRKLNEQGASFRGEVDRRYKNNLDALNTTGKPAEPWSPDEIYAAYPKNPDLAAKMVRDLGAAQNFGEASQKLALASPEEAAAIIEGQKPKTGEQDFATQDARYKAMNVAALHRGEWLHDDPAGYVLQHSPDMQSALGQLSQPKAGGSGSEYLAASLAAIGTKRNRQGQGMPRPRLLEGAPDNGVTLAPDSANPFEGYAATQTAFQDHLGVPKELQHVLHPQLAQSMAAQLTAPNADAKSVIDGWKQQWGGAFEQAFGDVVTLGKLPPAYQAIGYLENPADAADLSRLLGGMAKGSDPEKILGPKIVNGDTGIKSGVRGQAPVVSLMRSLDASGASLPFQQGMLTAIDQLAYAKMIHNNESQGDAVNHAVDAFAGAYSFGMPGGPRVPTKVVENVSAAADQQLADLKADDIAIPTIGIGGQYEPTADDYLRALKAAPKWVTSRREDGLYLKDPGGRVVMKKDGTPFTIPFTVGPPAKAPEIVTYEGQP